jgi:hypothetical protein
MPPDTPTDNPTMPDDGLLDGHDQADNRRILRSGRLPPRMSVVIKGKDKNFRPWSEKAVVTSLSGSGAGFFMSRDCSTGSLVSLIMTMPQHLRRYEHNKRLYRVWGLVQYCYEAAGDEDAGFHVGVALIGKEPPESYLKHPSQSYRVAGMNRDGLWRVVELDGTYQQRNSVRYWNSLEVSLYQLDEKRRSIAAEKTVTENVSEYGASVFSDLRVSVGDRIKFQCSSPPFSGLSIVRHRRIGVDDRTRLHLEFVENAFPILDVEAPIEEDGEH